MRRFELIVAWLGGVLFLASLARFVVFYLGSIGRVAPSSGSARWEAAAYNTALFVVFAVHHSLLARPAVKRWLLTWVPARLERAIYVWTASLLFLLLCATWRPLGGLVYALPGEGRWLGYGLQGLGVAFIARASAALDVLELAGIRQVYEANRPAAPDAEARLGSALRTTGVYRVVRHPVYLGWVLFVFGAPIMTTDRFLFAGLSVLYLVVAIPLEERALLTAFGAEYREYARRVRWRLLPGLY